MTDRKQKCFSYIRWSSKKQTQGTSLERQLEIAREIALEHDLDLVEIVDSGISAFRGRNTSDENALGRFINAVESGDIPNDSWLVVENLDRISRESAIDALHTLRRILKLGITVITGMDRAKYTYSSIKANDLNLFSSIMFFQRAHEESRTKSKRTYGHAKALINKFHQGFRVEGLPLAIKSVGTNAWWSDCSDGIVRKHPTYYDIAKGIIELTRLGWGSYRIADKLNTNEYPNCPTNKTGSWSSSFISRFLAQKSLYGLKEITIEGQVEQLTGYYPALMSKTEWEELRHIKKEKISKSTSIRQIGLLSGLGNLKCGMCGANIYCFTHKKTRLRYICGGGHQKSTDCKPWSFNAGWLEDTVLRLLISKADDLSKANHIDVTRKEVIKTNLKAYEREAENLINALSKARNSVEHSMLSKRLNLATQNIQNLTDESKAIYAFEKPSNQALINLRNLSEKVFTLTEYDLRLKTRHSLGHLITLIRCFQVKQRHIRFEITLKNQFIVIAYRNPYSLILQSKQEPYAPLLDDHACNWAVDTTDSPSIIEDEFYVYKTPDQTGIRKKDALSMLNVTMCSSE